eukprot:358604-Chlamydomonas_euryale.AAC.2
MGVPSGMWEGGQGVERWDVCEGGGRKKRVHAILWTTHGSNPVHKTYPCKAPSAGSVHASVHLVHACRRLPVSNACPPTGPPAWSARARTGPPAWSALAPTGPPAWSARAPTGPPAWSARAPTPSAAPPASPAARRRCRASQRAAQRWPAACQPARGGGGGSGSPRSTAMHEMHETRQPMRVKPCGWTGWWVGLHGGAHTLRQLRCMATSQNRERRKAGRGGCDEGAENRDRHKVGRRGCHGGAENRDGRKVGRGGCHGGTENRERHRIGRRTRGERHVAGIHIHGDARNRHRWAGHGHALHPRQPPARLLLATCQPADHGHALHPLQPPACLLLATCQRADHGHATYPR